MATGKLVGVACLVVFGLCSEQILRFLGLDPSQQCQTVSAQVPFNPLHFGEKLFQQYCVNMFIRIERDRIQWIKDNQKNLQADNYEDVTSHLRRWLRKKMPTFAAISSCII
uniref:Helitron helicase-like domain-containing protein n=1 Tax=Acrobeloides nanus TaxID=290746 RepID=A0A914DU67_9BILA